MAMEVKDNDVEPFRLLDLPPEIWSRICKLGVALATPISLNPDINLVRQGHYCVEPAHTRTCRAIRAESLRPFYEVNTFDLIILSPTSAHLTRWLKLIDAANRVAMGGISFSLNQPEEDWDPEFETWRDGVRATIWELEAFGNVKQNYLCDGGNFLTFKENKNSTPERRRYWSILLGHARDGLRAM